MTAEMWEEFKFAINPFAGDTKPNPAVTAEQNALSRASSKMMSKVIFVMSFLENITIVKVIDSIHIANLFNLSSWITTWVSTLNKMKKLRGTVES